MQVRNVMTRGAEYIAANTSLEDAAKKMEALDAGFLPIGDSPQGKLQGVVTDRDIVVRGLAKGKDPHETTVDAVKSSKVLYCFEDDDVEAATQSMRRNEVYRLIVLDNDQSRMMSGVVSLNDISGQQPDAAVADAAADISS